MYQQLTLLLFKGDTTKKGTIKRTIALKDFDKVLALKCFVSLFISGRNLFICFALFSLNLCAVGSLSPFQGDMLLVLLMVSVQLFVCL